MIVGKKYRAEAFWLTGDGGRGPKRPMQTGVCIFVHRKKRFCVLEFKGGVRASYYPEELK